MKKNILLIAGFVLAFTAVSCSLEENAEPVVDSVVPMEFTADAAVTKTAITGGNAVIWSEGDAISVFDGAGNRKFTAGTVGSTNTTFSGKAESGKETYYALYPYSADASLAGTTIHSVLPANQYSTADGTFDTMLAPAVAKAEENGNLTFVNVAGLVKFTFTGAGDRAVKSISMTADQSLTGSYSVDMSGEEFSAVATASASAGEIPAVSGITLTAKEGNLAAGPYYLVALPGTYSNVKISVVLSDGAKLNGSVGTLDIKAGKIKPTTIDLTEVQPTLYDKFMAGEDIVIAGKTYNKSQFEADEIKNVTNTNSSIYDGSKLLGNGKIIFVNIENQEKPLSIGNAADIVVIGVNPAQKVKVIRTASNLNVTDTTDHSRLVLHNLEIDMPNSTVNTIGFIANSSFGELTFSNCDIKMRDQALIQINTEGTTIDELNIVDCNIDIPSGSSNRYILTTGTNPYEMSSVNITNSVLHCDNGVAATFRLINGNSSSSQLTVNEFNFQNNTLVNLAYTNTTAVIVKKIDNVTVTKNLVYFNQSIDEYNSGSLYPNLLRPIDNGGVYPQTANADDNVSYQLSTDTHQRTFKVFSKDKFDLVNGEVINVFKKLTVDPFEGGDLSTFTPAPAYAEYGAQR